MERLGVPEPAHGSAIRNLRAFPALAVALTFATTGFRKCPRATWLRTPSRTDPRASAPAGCAAASRPGTPGAATRSGTRSSSNVGAKFSRKGGITANGSRPKRKAQERVLSSRIIPRRRPTLPRGLPRSTIGAEGLNCRVRNGNGCGPFARITGKTFYSFRYSSIKEKSVIELVGGRSWSEPISRP